MKDLVVLGTGGVGKYIIQAIKDINSEKKQWNFLGFLDDEEKYHGKEIDEYPVFGSIEWITRYPKTHAVIGVGSPRGRYNIVQRLHDLGHQKFATVIHPKSWTAFDVEVGTGSIIYPGVTVNRNVSLGRFALLNMNATVGHDTYVGNYSTLAPGANIAGNVKIGTGCDIGIGSSIIQQISVGEWTVVGAGAAVVSDLPSHIVAVGVPAKKIKDNTF